MPRMLRFESPGSIYHVMARGINGCDIFRESDDKHEFMRRFCTNLSQISFKCYAWCLMDNHYHFVIRTNEFPLSSLMRPVNGGYAQWFNKKYKRKGYLFQDRFKSVLCQDMNYVNELIRYIHLNPIRAGYYGTLRQLKQYQWNGHRELIGMECKCNVIDRIKTLRRFGESEKEAVDNYLTFLADGINNKDLTNAGRMSTESITELKGAEKGWPAIIGDFEYAKSAMQKHKVRKQRLHRKSDYDMVLDMLKCEACEKYGIKPCDFYNKGRGNSLSDARATFACKAHFQELIPYSVIADYLGISTAPVMRMARRINFNPDFH